MCLFVRLLVRFCPIQTSQIWLEETTKDLTAQGRGSGSGRLRSVNDETFDVADELRPPPQTAAAA